MYNRLNIHESYGYGCKQKQQKTKTLNQNPTHINIDTFMNLLPLKLF